MHRLNDLFRICQLAIIYYLHREASLIIPKSQHRHFQAFLALKNKDQVACLGKDPTIQTIILKIFIDHLILEAISLLPKLLQRDLKGRDQEDRFLRVQHSDSKQLECDRQDAED